MLVLTVIHPVQRSMRIELTKTCMTTLLMSSTDQKMRTFA